jgi:hypothetical protein
MIYASVAILGLLASASGKIYFKEDFNDKSWESRWTISEVKPKVGTNTEHSVPSQASRFFRLT